MALGRICGREKKTHVVNPKRFPRGQNGLSEKEGSHAFAKRVAFELGIGGKTVRRAAEFARAKAAFEPGRWPWPPL